MTPEEIDRLSRAAQRAGVALLELADGPVTVRLRLEAEAVAVPTAPTSRPAEAGPDGVRSPGVGLFRPRHPFTGRPACEPGASVDAGQIVGYLESGACLRPVAAPRRGIVGAPLVEEGSVVGYGALLYRLA